MTTTADPTAARRAPSAAPPGIRWARLVEVELRKQVDTRAGRWLLALIVLVDIVLMALFLWAADQAPGWATMTEAASVGQLLLLPLIGVLAATSEWSQRTAVTTFVLEPRRIRVHGAKAAAGVLLALGVMVVTVAAAALATLTGGLVHGGVPSWTVHGGQLGGLALALILLVLQGLGFGLSLLSTPAAIVAYLALPTAWTVVATLVPALREPARWLDQSGPLAELMAGSLTGDGWVRLLTSTLLWVGVPLAVGLWRTARRDVA
ncbi:ABC transporter permease [Cellulomonas sp. RIT-PI-Y]|uniref:ABC transporter permease n=1 Tax=Cellulomonas sp. RIT-PI-Y TaxID=3035297 RepID=UPI0021DAFA49|nr:ABC transporter permease [Cellulomonas sp. RIT-PI-Y]